MVIGLRPRAVVVGRSRGLALGIGECSVAGRVVWGGRTEQQRVAVPARSYTPLLLRAGLARVEGGVIRVIRGDVSFVLCTGR
jgi:hypothetical protein